jgi:hypothetical protein
MFFANRICFCLTAEILWAAPTGLLISVGFTCFTRRCLSHNAILKGFQQSSREKKQVLLLAVIYASEEASQLLYF